MELITTQTEIIKLFVSALLGAFLGVRREMAALESKKNRSFMGFRTMVLIAITGTISTFFPDMPWLSAICFVGLLTFLGIAYFNGAVNLHRIGITSEFSAILMFLIGVLVGYGNYEIAVVVTVILGYLNAFKSDLQEFFKTLTVQEWKGALQMLLLSAAVFPFLPREALDPWGVFVPFTVWTMVILISGIGLVGYFLTKYFGAKGGIPLTALLGAIVSSTAVTTSIGSQSRKMNLKNIFACGILVSLGTMQIKIAGVVWAIGIDKIKIAAAAPAMMGLISFLLAGYFWWRSSHGANEQQDADKVIKSQLSQPFEIKPAIFFGILFVAVLAAVTFGKEMFGARGVYLAAILSAMVDIDAIILSTVQSVRVEEISVNVAINAIGLAVIVNTLIKLFYLALMRAFPLMLRVLFPVLLASGVGAMMMFLL